MPVSKATFRRLADEDHEGKWELFDGRLRSKPSGTFGHNHVVGQLLWQLWRQLNRQEMRVVTGLGWLSLRDRTFLIPDVAVVSRETQRTLFAERDVLEVYPVPLPLVVEVAEAEWLRYPVAEKLAAYRERGDLEIWLLMPWIEDAGARTVTAWRRQSDGRYTETLIGNGAIEPVALPGVRIDLSSLFEWD